MISQKGAQLFGPRVRGIWSQEIVKSSIFIILDIFGFPGVKRDEQRNDKTYMMSK